MKNITVSAPGKLMLLGDHAVVHNRPCLVTAVGQRMRARIELIDEPVFKLEAPDVGITGYVKPMNQVGSGDIPKGAKFVEVALRNFIEISGSFSTLEMTGVKIETSSDFSSKFGFGSSSASTVCVLKALYELSDIRVENKTLFDAAYKTVLDIQAVGSGFDMAAAIYGGVLYFVGGGRVIEPVNVKSLPLIVGYTGVKADTATLVRMVGDKLNNNPDIYDNLFNISTTCVESGKASLVSGDFEQFGSLMNLCEGLLSAYGVETDRLASLIYAARGAGAYGAKLSGAGGGDCMIAVAPADKVDIVKHAITSVGGEILEVETNVEGVRVE